MVQQRCCSSEMSCLVMMAWARVLLNCKPEMVGMGSYDICFCGNELAASEKTIVHT